MSEPINTVKDDFNINYLNNNQISFIFNILKNTKKHELLFIGNKNSISDTISVIYKFFDLKEYFVISNWCEGLLTNYYQLCKSKKYKSHYEALSKVNLSELKYIILDELPDQNSNFYKELALLKKNLNIKFIAFIDLDASYKKRSISLIDYPLYFSNNELHNGVYMKLPVFYYFMNFINKK